MGLRGGRFGHAIATAQEKHSHHKPGQLAGVNQNMDDEYDHMPSIGETHVDFGSGR